MRRQGRWVPKHQLDPSHAARSSRRSCPQACLRLILAALLVLGITSSQGTHATPAGAATVPAFDHIFTLVMENQSYGRVIGAGAAPYLDTLAGQYGLATNYTAISHPSLPNYLAMTAGSTLGVTDDCTTCFQSAPNIADRIEASGRTWKAYQESMPGRCFTGDSYPYAQKHDPLVYFNQIRTNPSRCANIVPYSELSSDLSSAATTPNYAFITPNLCSDTHDCSIATGDAWLSQNVPAILQSPAFTTQNSLLFITWDEDDATGGSNHVATILAGRSVRPGTRSATPYDHYSQLRTIEDAWGLAPMAAGDAAAQPMTDFFGTSATPSTTPSPPPLPPPVTTPLTGGGPSGMAMPTGDIPGWHPVFSDDFTGTALGPGWGAYSGQPGGDPGGWWDPSHVVVHDGMLDLQTYQDASGRWVSGGVSSASALQQRYGKYLVRVRADKAVGVSAIALLWPSDNSWPPEIDFFEDGGGNRSKTTATLHCGGNANDACQVQADAFADFSQWHTIGVEWSPGLLTYTLDGKVWATMTSGVPAIPMEMDLQTQAGTCGDAYAPCPDASTPAHVNMQVDWVVAYAPSGAAAVPAPTITPAPVPTVTPVPTLTPVPSITPVPVPTPSPIRRPPRTPVPKPTVTTPAPPPPPATPEPVPAPTAAPIPSPTPTPPGDPGNDTPPSRCLFGLICF